MRHTIIFTTGLMLAAGVSAGEPAISPTEELRNTVASWVETMRKIQQEENDWARDQEVLQNYQEGLKSEIATIKEQIAAAEARKSSTDGETLDKEKQRDRLAAAKDMLVGEVRRLEEELAAKLPLFPRSLTDDPRVSQGIVELKQALDLPDDQRDQGVSKRLMNVINLVGEAEKFQATVHVREELHKDQGGREYNMQMVYFGLACAYGVDMDGGYALVGRPGGDGWRFEERADMAGPIQSLIDAIHGDQDAAFINLPLLEP